MIIHNCNNNKKMVLKKWMKSYLLPDTTVCMILALKCTCTNSCVKVHILSQFFQVLISLKQTQLPSLISTLVLLGRVSLQIAPLLVDQQSLQNTEIRRKQINVKLIVFISIFSNREKSPKIYNTPTVETSWHEQVSGQGYGI